MPRSIWNGTIAFGLVNVPVKVFSATESKTVHFHEVHAKDGGRIEHRRICPNDDEQVDYDDIVKGFEVKRGEWVELTDDEIAAAAGTLTRLVDIDHFVPAADIDPVFYERTYYVGAGDKGEDAYALLHATLERSGRAGVGRWVFHNRERTVIVRPLDDVLALHTMRYADDLVDGKDLDLPRLNRRPSDRELDMAAALVEGLETRFKPDAYEDTYRKEVLEVIKRKAAGKPIEPPDEPDTEPSDDLMAALEASMKGNNKRRSAGARS
jgi:DNA end-binding protein Ku